MHHLMNSNPSIFNRMRLSFNKLHPSVAVVRLVDREAY